ncbi:MAG: hypothetical protein MJ120_01845 [Clostridia bacterium]|nr:hypothetical protein [Clostridia bacterium]
MKQSKRMLSVLLAIIMICSTFTVGAQAMRAEITAPGKGYDEVIDPVITSEQAARMLLDEIEPLLADMNVDEKVAGLVIRIQSVDTLLDTVHNLGDSTLVGFAKAIANLGDIEKLALKAGDVKDSKGNVCRRNNSTSTDFEVLGAVLTFLETNATYIAKFAYNGFDFGWLDGLGVFGNDDLAALYDVHSLVVTLVDKLLAGEEFEFDIEQRYSSTKTLDGILQDFIDNKLVKMIVDGFGEKDGSNQVAEILGLNDYLAEDGTLKQDVPTTKVFPSLTAGNLGKLSLNGDSIYDFISKVFHAAINDVVIPYAGTLLGDLLSDDVAQYIDIALPILEIDMTFPEGASGKEKIDMLLNYLLVGEGKTKFICFKEATSPSGVAVKYLSLADGFWTMLTNILRTVLPMLPPLLGEDCPDFSKTDAELAELSTQEFLTYVIQAVLEKFVDGVEFAEDCHSIRELASRTLIEVCKDLMPEKNFEEEFEAGQKVYDSDDCLTLAAYVIRYYLNGETTIQDTTPDASMNLVSMLNTAADWALNKFGSVFGYDKTKYSNASVWKKAYDTAFSLIPLNLFVGATPSGGVYMPGVPDSPTGLENIFMDDIIGGVLEFNITEGNLKDVGITGLNKVLSLIGRRSDSDFNKPLPQFIMDLLGRLINPLFGLPTEKDAKDQLSLIIPYNYTSLDQLVTANKNTTTCSLTNTLYRLCLNIGYINKGTSSLFYAGCPFITQLMGLWGGEKGKYRYPFVPEEAPTDFNGGRQYGYEELKALYDQYADESNDGIEYDDPAYSYFHMVDFQPYLYLDFKSARSTVAGLLEDYREGVYDPISFRTIATDAAYRFLTVIRFLEQGYNMDKSVSANENNYQVFGETTANDNQLIKVINKANALNVSQEEYADGTKKYSDRTWTAYSRAKAFADKVEAEYKAAASAGANSGKLLRDLRQSRINTARKKLVDAMAGLKSWVPLADYTMLDGSIEVAGYYTSLRKYSEKSIQRALEAYLGAVKLDRDYDADDQYIVDEKQISLDDALNRLQEEQIDYLELWNDGYGQYIDEINSYLFGLEEGFATQQAIDEIGGGIFNDYMLNYGMAVSPVDGYALATDITSTKTGNGTGAVIKMYEYDDEGNLINPRKTNYTVVIFGDMDGDSFSNAMDTFFLKSYMSMSLSEAQVGKAAVYAADADDNGKIENADVKLYEDNGLMKTVINQAPESRIYNTYGILDRLGLN